MKTLIFFILALASFVHAEPEIPLQVLAKVNGKVISTLDIAQKLDQVFDQQFPQYKDIPQARMDFYRHQWNHVLKDLIEQELMLSDAEAKKMPITDADIRQELDEMFGPNIYQTLEGVGISYEEAREIVRKNILVRRMMYLRVNSKARQKITPKRLIAAYDDFASHNKYEKEWHYQVLSIRGETPEEGEALLARAKALAPIHPTLDGLKKALTRKLDESGQTQVSLSELYERKHSALSKDHLAVLEELEEGKMSAPITQISRSSQKKVHRIFFLKEMKDEQEIAFETVAKQIEEKLMQQEIVKETEKYMRTLYDEYHVETFAEQLPAFLNAPMTS